MINEIEEGLASDAPVEEQDEEAQSSSAVESETEADLLAVVQDTLQPEEQNEEADSQPHEEESEEDDDDLEHDDEDSGDLAASESFDDVPFNKHPRFKKLINERNELRPKAEQYDQITGYLQREGLSPEEAAKGFEIMSLMKNNPLEAAKALQPYLDNLSVATGQTLPQDVQQRVDDGYIDESDAAEIARLRAENQRIGSQQAVTQEQISRSNLQQSQTQTVNAVVAWEQKIRSSDPDYDLKADELDDRVKVIMSDRRAAGNASRLSPDEALGIAKQAYEEVNRRTQARVGNKKPIRSASGGKLGGTPHAEPSSLMEAVQNALSSSA